MRGEATNLTVTVDGVENAALVASIAQAAGSAISDATGSWTIVGAAADGDRWSFTVHGPASRDVFVVTGPAAHLPERIVEPMRAIVGAAAGTRRRPKLHAIYSNAAAKAAVARAQERLASIPPDPPLREAHPMASLPVAAAVPAVAPAVVPRRRAEDRRQLEPRRSTIAWIAVAIVVPLAIIGASTSLLRLALGVRAAAPLPAVASPPAPEIRGPEIGPRPGDRHFLDAAPTPAVPAGQDTPSTNEDGHWLSPRLRKLGVKPSWRASTLGLSDARLVGDLIQSVGELWIDRVVSRSDAIFFGVRGETDLSQIEALKSSLKPAGVLWIVHPRTSRPEVLAATRAAGFTERAVVPMSAGDLAGKFVLVRRSVDQSRRGARQP